MNTIEQIITDRLIELLNLIDIDNLKFEVGKSELIEATAVSLNNDEPVTLLKLEVRESNQSIYIPNIFLPPVMRELGIAMRMLWLIFAIGHSFGYRVYLTLVTDSTKLKMLNRGAIHTMEPDILEIVSTTNLFTRNDPNQDLYMPISLP